MTNEPVRRALTTHRYLSSGSSHQTLRPLQSHFTGNCLHSYCKTRWTYIQKSCVFWGGHILLCLDSFRFVPWNPQKKRRKPQGPNQQKSKSIMGNFLCIILGWLIPSLCSSPSPVYCHLQDNKATCESTTSFFGTTCNWGSCDNGSCNDPNVEKCYMPLPSGSTCEDVASHGEDVCITSLQGQFECDFTNPNSCTSCTVCFVTDLRRRRRLQQDDEHPYQYLFASLWEDGPAKVGEVGIQEEFMKLQQLYHEDLNLPSRSGICENPRSKHHGRSLSVMECMNPDHYHPKDDNVADGNNSDNSNSGGGDSNNEEDDDAAQFLPPWTSPNMTTMNGGGELLVRNPGIWYYENFLNPEELDSMHYLSNKYGKDLGMYGPCRYDSHPMNAHPNSGKQCFKMSIDQVCDGPYRSSNCDGTVTDPQDSAIVEQLLQKVQSLWSTTIDPEPHIKFQLTDAGTIPMHLHHDHRTITFMIYLTDGGAGTVFPNVNVTLPPKAGAAATWLNYDREGKRNPLADHAVQAHPGWAGERLSVAVELRSKTPQHFLESQFK